MSGLLQRGNGSQKGWDQKKTSLDNSVHLIGCGGVSAPMGSYDLVQSVQVSPSCIEAVTLVLCCLSYQPGVLMVGLQRQDR